MSSIFFSIIIPCYNQGRFLGDCLDAILQQSYQNWEAVVVNDGSTDNSRDVVEGFLSADSRIRLITKDNGGLSSARNAGIRQANGERLIFLDADDTFSENCLLEINRALEGKTDEYVSLCGYRYINEDGTLVLHRALPDFPAEMIPMVFSEVPGPCHSLSVSKKLLSKAGFFDEGLKSLEDWDMWIRLAKCGGKLTLIPKMLVNYRYVNNSMSRNAMVMFESFKTVATRAPRLDNRIVAGVEGNRDYDFNIHPVVIKSLFRSLGLHVMQNHIDDSLALFKHEIKGEMSKIKPADFEVMCSSLTFRYWKSRQDTVEVLNIIQPRFLKFFQQAGFDDTFVKAAMFSVFKRHIFLSNVFRFGRIVGGIFNHLLRVKYRKYAIV